MYLENHVYHLVTECVTFFTICTLIENAQSLHCDVIVQIQWYVEHTVGLRAQNLVYHCIISNVKYKT